MRGVVEVNAAGEGIYSVFADDLRQQMEACWDFRACQSKD